VLNYGALGRAGKAEVTSGTISRDQWRAGSARLLSGRSDEAMKA